MTIKIQRVENSVIVTIKEGTIAFSKALTMLEARNLRDYLTDMVLHEGDPSVIEALIRAEGNPECDVAPLPANFELIALADAQRRNAVKDNALREFYFGDNDKKKEIKERSDP